MSGVIVDLLCVRCVYRFGYVSGLCREHGNSYTVYLITVVKKLSDGVEDSWDVYRRYSDFDDFHAMLLNRVSLIYTPC